MAHLIGSGAGRHGLHLAVVVAQRGRQNRARPSHRIAHPTIAALAARVGWPAVVVRAGAHGASQGRQNRSQEPQKQYVSEHGLHLQSIEIKPRQRESGSSGDCTQSAALPLPRPLPQLCGTVSKKRSKQPTSEPSPDVFRFVRIQTRRADSVRRPAWRTDGQRCSAIANRRTLTQGCDGKANKVSSLRRRSLAVRQQIATKFAHWNRKALSQRTQPPFDIVIGRIIATVRIFFQSRQKASAGDSLTKSSHSRTAYPPERTENV